MKRSMLIVFEFIGCLLFLSGVIWVNFWNIDMVVEVMNSVIIMKEFE